MNNPTEISVQEDRSRIDREVDELEDEQIFYFKAFRKNLKRLMLSMAISGVYIIVLWEQLYTSYEIALVGIIPVSIAVLFFYRLNKAGVKLKSLEQEASEKRDEFSKFRDAS
ncbi:hypothetical protein COB64_01360 [Candidatus Wolfebacteria bacterium]|nr:MAG: hypothetical protein COB64_01360 [Candidatus Wolfebacteria bacterium]